MSKITNCLLLIRILSSGKIYTTKELSTELKVSERMIRYYKQQLEESGYIIESFKGPHGGYYMNKDSKIYINYFNKYDIELLNKVENQLQVLNSNLALEYHLLNKKLNSIYNTNRILSEYKKIDINIDIKNDKINIINTAIKKETNLLIDYLSISNRITKREITPIYIFEYNKITYITAFCKLRGTIRHFNLDNILSVKEI